MKKYLSKNILFVLTLPCFSALGMEVIVDQKEPLKASAISKEAMYDNYITMANAQILAKVLVRAKAGNLDAPKLLCSFCVHPSIGPEQKLQITDALQELMRGNKAVECRMQACCALAYLYATFNAPRLDSEDFLTKTTRYLLEGYSLILKNRDKFLLKVQLVKMLDIIVHRWTSELRGIITSSNYRNILDSQLDLLSRLKKNLIS